MNKKIYYVFLVTLLTTLFAALPSRADIVPQTTDDTNPDTYYGWVDNTDGHITSITSSSWSGGSIIPQTRFIYINQVNFPDKGFRRRFSGFLYRDNSDIIDQAYIDGVYDKRGKGLTGSVNPFWNANNYETQTGYLTEQEISLIRKMDVGSGGPDTYSLEGIKFFFNLEKLMAQNADYTKLTSLDVKGLKLTYLHIGNNNIVDLDASDNQLGEYTGSGNIWDSESNGLYLARSSYLQRLDVHHNLLTGISNGIASCPSLNYVDISRNQIKLDRMRALIADLPVPPFPGTLRVLDNSQGDEGNELNDELVAIAMGKNWRVCFFDGEEWEKYICDSIELNETNFPNANLRHYIRNYLYEDNQDTFDEAFDNGDYLNRGLPKGQNPFANAQRISREEAIMVRNINLNTQVTGRTHGQITDLTGLAYFYYLTNLDCSYNNLGVLDVSALTQLTRLTACCNRMKSINIRGCTKLEYINISQNSILKREMNLLSMYLHKRTEESWGTLIVYNNDDPNYPELNEFTMSMGETASSKYWYVKQSINGTLSDYVSTIDDYVYLNEENFPNQLLRKYITDLAYSDNYNLIDEEIRKGYYASHRENWWGEAGQNVFYGVDYLTAQEVNLIKELNIHKWNEQNRGNTERIIDDMTGIKLLTSLEFLNVSGHQLQSLDVSNMPKLRVLRCHEQRDSCMKSLNVSNCDSLFQIYCDVNKIEQINVTTCPNLNFLRCHDNPLNENGLNVTENPLLERLDCFNCGLSELNVSKNPKLRILYCYETNDSAALGKARRGKITELDLSKNPDLVELRCSNNPLTDLDLTNNTKLEILYCNLINLHGKTMLTNLKENLPVLRQLSCHSCELTGDELDVSNNPALTELICYNNQIEILDLSNNLALDTLICGDNQVGNDFRVVPLPTGGNHLTTLDLSANVNLTYLSCAKNWLTELDLTGLKKLKFLNYAEQIRTVEAWYVPVWHKEDNTLQQLNLYYMRMDENKTDKDGKILQDRMKVTDHQHLSYFDINRADMNSWCNVNGDDVVSVNVFEGTRNTQSSAPRRVAATESDLNSEAVIGKIIVLNPVTETDTEVSGQVIYNYDVRLDPEAEATDEYTHFTLNWYTNPGVVTGIEHLNAQRNIVATTYYNVAGMAKSQPWPGVNIIEIRYDDGTVTMSKQIYDF